jgi:hypothetical protein
MPSPSLPSVRAIASAVQAKRKRTAVPTQIAYKSVHLLFQNRKRWAPEARKALIALPAVPLIPLEEFRCTQLPVVAGRWRLSSPLLARD